MIDKLTHTTVWVLDQDEALDFYTRKLGFAVTPTRRWTTFAGSRSARPDSQTTS